MIAFTRLQRHHLTQSLEKRAPHPHIRIYQHHSFLLTAGHHCVGCTLIALAAR
jgi:hypothetical protein